MPVDFSSHRNGSYVRITGYGDISDAELLRAVRLMYADDEQTKRHRCALLDFSRVEKANVSNETIRDLARLNINASKLVTPGAAVALVAPDSLVYGLARMWGAYAESTEWATQVFQDLGDAEAWLEEQLAV